MQNGGRCPFLIAYNGWGIGEVAEPKPNRITKL